MGTIEWFRKVVELSSSEEAFTAVMSKPALLWSDRWPEIECWIARQPPEKREALTKRLHAIQKLAAGLEADPRQWRLGDGPIETLAKPVISGERILDQSLADARTAEITAALSPLYVRVLARRTASQAIDGQWQNAVSTFKLLLAAIDALESSPGASEMCRFAVAEWIQVVAVACEAVPDGRWFADALRRGEALVRSEIAEGRRDLAAEVTHRLGVLHLDPYISGRSSRSYENQIRMWRQRLADFYGKAVASDPSTAMPEPVAALGTAVRFLDQAAPDRSGEPRGLTLKAAAEALSWRQIAGGPREPERIRKYAQEALALLPSEKYPTHVAVLHGLLRRLGAGAPAEAGNVDGERGQNYLLWADPNDETRTDGDTDAVERYVRRAAQTLQSDPDLAIGLLLRVWPLLRHPRHEMTRQNAAQDIGNGLARIFAADVLKSKAWDGPSFEKSVVERAKTNNWSAGRFGAALAGLAFATTKFDREQDGLRLIGRALEIVEQANAALAPPLRVIRAALMIGMAVNAYNVRDWDAATREYVEAVRAYGEEGLIELAMEGLARAEDITFNNPANSPVALAVGLANDAAMLGLAGAPRLDDRLQALWQRVVARTFSQKPVNVELMWLEMQAAKGAVFAAMISQESRYDWRRDPEATAVLARIEQLRNEANAVVPDQVDPEDEELLLMSYAGVRVQSTPTTDPLANLEQHFDTHVRRHMTDGRAALKSFLGVDELQACIGPRSVFMSQLVGQTEDGQVALITAAQTNETTIGTIGILQVPPMTVEIGGAEMGPFALVIAALREAVIEEPGPAIVAPEAARLLAEDAASLLGGGLNNRLKELRDGGKDHLCIHPHGPFHFHPQHLIGLEGRPLAEDWIVTYLPHPALLRRRSQEQPSVAKADLVALGLDFKDSMPHGLDPLPGAVAEATIVASTFGGKCWTNTDATRARWLEALTGARRVHVATHGSQHASAPIFQRLYFYPDDVSNGVFHAYEIVGLDLRHLDLVTLSACETSLGRFDVGDTLRGLTATLFAAGVATIVSTLWPVEDESARLFFESFYRTLREGGSKLEAFRNAQLKTRKMFPAYRDWGAFQFSGLW